MHISEHIPVVNDAYLYWEEVAVLKVGENLRRVVRSVSEKHAL